MFNLFKIFSYIDAAVKYTVITKKKFHFKRAPTFSELPSEISTMIYLRIHQFLFKPNFANIFAKYDRKVFFTISKPTIWVKNMNRMVDII